MIMRLQAMGFRTGDRLATKKKKPEYGNAVQAIGSKLWALKLDNGSTVAMTSQTIKKVEAQAALSSVAATDALAAGGGPRHDGDVVVLHGDSDTDTDEAEAEKVNVHAAHQQEAWAAILGTKARK
jgi:DNA-binding helix-hairpin-helix protein with protein kinase domain